MSAMTIIEQQADEMDRLRRENAALREALERGTLLLIASYHALEGLLGENVAPNGRSVARTVADEVNVHLGRTNGRSVLAEPPPSDCGGIKTYCPCCTCGSCRTETARRLAPTDHGHSGNVDEGHARCGDSENREGHSDDR